MVVIEDACRAIDLNGSLAAAKAEMAKAGVALRHPPTRSAERRPLASPRFIDSGNRRVQNGRIVRIRTIRSREPGMLGSRASWVGERHYARPRALAEALRCVARAPRSSPAAPISIQLRVGRPLYDRDIVCVLDLTGLADLAAFPEHGGRSTASAR